MVTSRILFTAKQKDELWERWKNGQSVLAISRALERRNKTGVQRIVALNGGICSGDHCSASFCATRHRNSPWSVRRDFPWDCGRPVGPSDRTRSQTIAIDDKPGDSTQRRFAELPCKPGREEHLGAGAAP